MFNWRHLRRLTVAVLAGALVVAVAFPVLYAVAVSEHRPEFNHHLPVPPEASYRVSVIDWGYHTAIVLEQPPGWRLGPPGAESAPFLEYAWGDRAFYQDADYRPDRLAATLIAPTESVLYLRGHPGPPRPSGADAVLTRTVGAAALRALALDLERSVRRTADGDRQRPSPAPGGHFYPAHGEYLWTRNCNWWTVARLAGVELADSPSGVVFTPQATRRLRGFSETQPSL